MNLKILFGLFLLSLGAISVTAIFQTAPGYMDADYYMAGGIQLFEGRGFQEFFLWNYLDDPVGIPHPSHGYWMPMASILAAGGMWVTRSINFSGARLFFVLLGASLAPFTAWVSFSLTGKREHAILAGLLAALPAFYLPYLGTIDTFGVYMLLGTLWLQVAFQFPKTGKLFSSFISGAQNTDLPRFLALGFISGLMHFSRADGILWLGMGLLFVLYRAWEGEDGAWLAVKRVFICALGYLVVMGPWMGRNLIAFGAPLAPGGARGLWITHYDDLYAFPGSLLTFDRWIATGLPQIFAGRLWALGQNVQTAFAVQGGIFLSPLAFVGFWQLRKDKRVIFAFAAWLVTLLIMTFVFPYQGARGGFFHSGTVIQPMVWAMVPLGLDVIIDWIGKKRRWDLQQARMVFGIGTVLLVGMLSFLIVKNRVIGNDPFKPVWESSSQYTQLERVLKSRGAGPDDLVMVNNPPGYFLASRRPAIVIPDGGEAQLLAAAKRYSASYLWLESNHPAGLNDLYENPGDRPGMTLLESLDGNFLYRFQE